MPRRKAMTLWWWGSGGAGLAAAIQAHDEGASVLIVEKNADYWRQHHQKLPPG